MDRFGIYGDLPSLDWNEDHSANDLVFHAAYHHFKAHGADESEGALLVDEIMAALCRVEAEDAFEDMSAAVERAYNRLRINGYRCEQNWQCCRTCGWDMIPWEDADHAVWYHKQDRASAIETGELYFVWQGDARLIRQAFEAEGLAVVHGGSFATRIMVKRP
jgi:hypothetical protein